jgi:asparaginyl-tRNA synthetase
MKVYINKIQDYAGQEVTLEGWVANKRTGKGIAFIILRDGTGFIQCVVSQEGVPPADFENAEKLTLESSLAITGKVVKDEKQEGGFELQATGVKVYSIAEEYPIAKKEHGVEFLMNQRHLWLRSRRQWAIMRVRNRLIHTIHRFFQERGFMHMDAPIFTENASEGTSTLFETDFYGQPAYLSQSGQLYGEAMAFAQGLIYTFGPTFRAEKSKTRRHLSEFWMMEPEMCFYDNDKNMDLIEEFLRYVIRDVLTHCKTELQTVERDVAKLEKADAKFTRSKN